jgi:hypothetical protein
LVSQDPFWVFPVERKRGVAAPEIQPEASAHFKVEVRVILTVRRADGSHSGSPRRQIANADPDGVEVSIERLNVVSVRIAVLEEHHIPPAASGISGEEHQPIRRGEYGVSEI